MLRNSNNLQSFSIKNISSTEATTEPDTEAGTEVKHGSHHG